MCLALSGARIASARIQNPAAQGSEMTTQDSSATFKSKVNLVLVPVVVRDRQGHAVGNLEKQSFKLFDKGKVQTISKFSVEKLGSHAHADGNTAAEKVTPVVAPGEEAIGKDAASALPERYVAYLFDDLHFQFGDLVRVQKAATKHIGSALQPTDRAAIYTTSGQGNLDFTDDRTKLQAAVMRLRQQPMFTQQPNQCPDMNYYLADLIINKHDQQALQASIADTIVCASLSGPGAQQTAQAMVQGAASSFIGIGEQGTRVTLSVLKDVVRRISAMPGQRTIVLISPGFLTLAMESFEDKTEILDRAAHANVIISGLDARGLYTDSTYDASQRGSATTQMSILKSQYARAADSAQADVLAEMADGTGGTFFQNSNDLDAGFKRVAAAPEYVYMLGFSPQNLKMDGSFHKLKIALQDANGLAVQARRGYYAPKHLKSDEDNAKSEIEDAVFSREEMHDIPVDLHTQFFKPDPTEAKLTVLARVDLKHIRFKKLEGRNRNDLTVVSVIFDSNGNYVTGNRKVIEMRLKDETLERLNSGITVKTSFDIKPGTYLVRLVVRDADGQMMSAQNGAVDIP